MKRLFRTSKAGMVDPLPPPVPPSPGVGQGEGGGGHGQGVRKSMNTMFGGHGDKDKDKAGVAGGVVMSNGHGHAEQQPQAPQHSPFSHQHETRPRQGSVTPFPLDLVPTQPNEHGVNGNGKKKDSRISSDRTLRPSGAGPPSLLEIQQMQAAAAAATSGESDRSREWVQSQQKPSPSRFYEGGYTPTHDVGRQNGYTEGYGTTPPSNVMTMPVPQPSPLPSPGSIPTPSTINAALYPPPPPLPPGARPPTPPNVSQLRPSTPTRPPYAESHTSSNGNGHQYPTHIHTTPEESYPIPPPRSGRDRGYSSASGRASDHESTSNHGHVPLPIPMNSHKAAPPGLSARSPLSYSYATEIVGQAAFPVAHPLATSPPYQVVPQQMQGRGENKDLPARPNGEAELTREIGGLGLKDKDKDKDKDKEKKKFWGKGMAMSWGDKKEKEKDKEREKDRVKERDGRQLERLSFDDRRPSFEELQSVPPSSHGHVSSHGHGEEEGGLRGRLMDLTRMKDVHHSPSSVDNVTTAIQILCSHPDPSFASTYEVCDRINHSSNPDTVSKEAAQALRKQIKHGNEVERRTAAKVWLVMMRNIHKAFRAHATSKKFVAALEPLLLPSTQGRPLISTQTHRFILDILSDLTYNYGGEKGCEGLSDLWKKAKAPQDPERGAPLPSDHQVYRGDGSYTQGTPNSQPNSRRPSSFSIMPPPPKLPPRGTPPAGYTGPGYAQLPDHGEDIRRLMDECTAAKEAARVLAEALVYTRPDELEYKPIIKEFYRKCFLAHESLTNQIEWAQAEAAQSRERVILSEQSTEGPNGQYETTVEERALASLFEAHEALAEVLTQHDELERLARDENELREVRERSKKETRLERNQPTDQSMLSANGYQQSGSSSRSPSPTPAARLPHIASPRDYSQALPLPVPSRPQHSEYNDFRSRTPSPESHVLPQPPKFSASPARTASPLGMSDGRGMRGPRPLPNPFAMSKSASQSSMGGNGGGTNPSRSGTGSTLEQGDDEVPSVPAKPSRKALGKRRAIPVEDSNFDPNDMFSDQNAPVRARAPSTASSTSITADEVFLSKPVTYVYDAYREKVEMESRQGGVSGSSLGVGRSRVGLDLRGMGGGEGYGGGGSAGSRAIEAR